MGWNIKEALNPLPPEDEYVCRVESVDLHVPEDDGKFPSLMFKLKIISPEVDDSIQEQATFRTLNPKWLRFLADDIANANVLNTLDSGDNSLDPSDYSDMAQKVDELFSGKTFRYNCSHGMYNGRPSANWNLVGPTASF